MLEGYLCPIYLSLLSHASQLPAQLGALRKTRRSKWMALRNEPTARINYVASTVGKVTLVNALTSLSLTTEAQSFICNQLIRRKTIVQFDDLDVCWCFIGHFIHILGALLGHIVAYEAHAGSFLFIKYVIQISRQINSKHFHCLLLQIMLHNEFFTRQNCTCSSIRSRAALQLGQRGVNRWRVLYLLECIDVPELRVGIIRAMSVILLSDFREMLRLSPVLLHVFASCVTKDFGGKWRFGSTSQLNTLADKFLHGIRSVTEKRFQRAFEHFFEA